MRLHTKTTIIATISCLTLSLGATPAFASIQASPFAETSAASIAAPTHAPGAAQSLVTDVYVAEAAPLEAMIQSVDITSVVPHGFDVDGAVAQALAEVGTSRPTGWSQPGECIMSAQRWIKAGDGNWSGGGTPVSNYETATRMSFAAALPGDIIQYEYTANPNAWVSGVHTVMITEVNENGTFDIVESNNPGGSGLVGAQSNWTPAPPTGFTAALWRF